MSTKEETVIYEMGDDAQGGAFEYDFPHLYYRICQIREAMTAYYLGKNVNALVGADFCGTGLPYFSEVAFPAERAKKYCERMERYFARIPRDNEVLPRPRFAVSLTVEFGGGIFERFEFDFRLYGEEYLTEFCKKVRERGQYYFRSRARNNYRKIVGTEK